MKVYFDSSGYPNEIIFNKMEKERFTSSNFESLKEIYQKLKKIMDYWKELSESYESCQYGDLDEREYYNRMIDQQKKYFSEDNLEDYKRLQLW